jgi:hypothetical protein
MMKKIRMNRQNGVATVLILILTGLSLTGIVYGTMFYIRGTQESVKTTHSATQAQIRAWTGVEVTRKFLEQFGEDRALSLTSGYALSVTGLSGVKMVVDQVNTTAKTITMNITGCSNADNPVCAGGNGTQTGSTSTIQAVFSVNGTSSTTTPSQLNDVLNFKGDVIANGGIAFRGGSNNVTVRVDGNFTSSSGLDGINTLYSTRNITLSGGGLGSNSLMAANGNITLTASGSYGSVNAMGNVSINGSVSAVSIKSNGTTTLGSSSRIPLVQSIGDVTINGWTTYDAIQTKGNVFHNAGTVTSLQAEGNITQNGWISVVNGTIGGRYITPSGNTNNIVSVNGYQVNIQPLTEITLTDYHVDTNLLKNSANYAFEIDSNGNRIVTVKDVSGISNGTYFHVVDRTIAGTKYNDYLCTVAAPTLANQCLKKIGRGFDAVQNALISYNSTNKQWRLNGQMLAPGVAWFDGNLEVASGTYYNTFLATYNISTAGASRPYSINSAGYANVCTQVNFTSTYPTNYCNLSTNSLIDDAMGNSAMIAGSYEPGQSTPEYFRGGNINLGASSVVYGNVIAGNILTTGGSTTIYGRVSTSNQSQGTNSNTLGGSTTIDISNESTTGNQVNTGGNTGTSSTPSSTILWTRYI